jgi:hypothetical protein
VLVSWMHAEQRYTYLVGIEIKAVDTVFPQPALSIARTRLSRSIQRDAHVLGKGEEAPPPLPGRKRQIGRKYLLLHCYEWGVFLPCPVTVGYPHPNGKLPDIGI